MPVGDSLDRMHRPVATKTASIGTSAVSLVGFGFTLNEVQSAKRCFIYVHSTGLQVKWAPDAPRGSPTGFYDDIPLWTPPTVAVGDGHGIAAGVEREIDGTEQCLVLRMISAHATNSALATITLEG